MLTFKSGDTNFRAHCRLRHRQRNDAVQVVSFSIEKWMLLHMQNDVEIAGWPSERSGFTAAGKSDASAIFHTRGNFRVYRALAKNPAFAFALEAGIGNHVAGSLAGRTRPRNAEKALLIAHL